MHAHTDELAKNSRGRGRFFLLPLAGEGAKRRVTDGDRDLWNNK